MKRFLFFFIITSIWLFSSSEIHASSSLLTKPWQLRGRSGPSERYQLIDPNSLKGNTTLRLTYDLKGTCLLDGDASAIIFDQPVNKQWRYISLSRYGKNCYRGEQVVDIPLSHFRGLDLTKPVGTFHMRIWSRKAFDVDITHAVLYSTLPTTVPQVILPSAPFTPSPSLTPIPSITIMPSTTPVPIYPSATIIPTPSISPTPTAPQQTTASWSIQSVSSMKETKDRVCWQRSSEFIAQWVQEAVSLGVNYVSIETPYDNPSCGSAVAYTEVWIQAIRKAGLNVWHRHMPLAFEGIYNTPKNASTDYLPLIHSYIKDHPTFFAPGDIFTPIPEPQNGGIVGVTYCAQNVCMFRSIAHFNQWLRAAMDVSEAAFGTIGLSGKMKIGYFGFDGFVAWGDNNPDWDGILEDATVVKMGNITIDHYPEVVGDTMENDLAELERRYPYIPIIIGEWGTIAGSNRQESVQKTMQAAKRASVVGFNYWHFGIGGNEGLIEENFSHRDHFGAVRQFYTK